MTESDDVVAQALGRPDPFKGLKAGTTADVVARALGRAPSGPDEWMESSLEGGNNHAGSADVDAPSTLDQRMAALREKVAASGLVRRFNR